MIPFKYDSSDFHIITFKDDPSQNFWFINKEICDYLGYRNPRDAMAKAKLLISELMYLRIYVCDI